MLQFDCPQVRSNSKAGAAAKVGLLLCCRFKTGLTQCLVIRHIHASIPGLSLKMFANFPILWPMLNLRQRKLNLASCISANSATCQRRTEASIAFDFARTFNGFDLVTGGSKADDVAVLACCSTDTVGSATVGRKTCCCSRCLWLCCVCNVLAAPLSCSSRSVGGGAGGCRQSTGMLPMCSSRSISCSQQGHNLDCNMSASGLQHLLSCSSRSVSSDGEAACSSWECCFMCSSTLPSCSQQRHTFSSIMFASGSQHL